MKMLIPVCGDVIKIAKDVDVELKNIAQNTNFLEKYDEKLKNVKQISKKKHFITLKKGTLLTIDRVYIRQGDSAEYNSITFKINKDKNLPNGPLIGISVPISVSSNRYVVPKPPSTLLIINSSIFPPGDEAIE